VVILHILYTRVVLKMCCLLRTYLDVYFLHEVVIEYFLIFSTSKLIYYCFAMLDWIIPAFPFDKLDDEKVYLYMQPQHMMFDVDD